MILPPEKYFGHLKVLKWQGKPIFATQSSANLDQVRHALQKMTGNTYVVETWYAPPALSYGGATIWGIDWPPELKTPVSAKAYGKTLNWGWTKEPAAAKVIAAALYQLGLTIRGRRVPWSGFEASRWI